MIRHRSPRRPPRKRPSIPRDNKKMLITLYLFRKSRKGATPNELAKKATMSTQAGDVFKEYLEELLEMKWVTKEKIDIGGGMSKYTITQKGIKAIGEAKRLVDEGHPLSQLDAFDNINIDLF